MQYKQITDANTVQGLRQVSVQASFQPQMSTSTMMRLKKLRLPCHETIACRICIYRHKVRGPASSATSDCVSS